MQGLKHLVFEPDGPMLQLPPYLLISRQQGLDAYLARQAKADADPFDIRGIDWLGRGREVSISVSPRSFLDMRAIAPSRARQRLSRARHQYAVVLAADGRGGRRMRLADDDLAGADLAGGAEHRPGGASGRPTAT